MKYGRWTAIIVLVLLVALLSNGIGFAQALEVSTNAATGVTSSSATLNGNLTSLGNASSVNVWFDYATDAFYTSNGNTYSNSTSTQAMSAVGLFNSPIANLLGNTTYHFRAVASDGNNTAYGNDSTFTTEITPLAVTTGSATGVTSNSATLNGNLTSMGNASSVNVWFQYATDAYYVGNSGSYSNLTTPQAMGAIGPFNALISSLSGSTTYHFRAAASDGNTTVNGSDATFTTQAQPLGVTTSSATSITSNSATLNGNLTGMGNASSVNVWFQYATDAYYIGNSGSYSNSTASQAMGAIGPFNSSIIGLSANTTYHFRAEASDGSTTVSGSDATFATEALPLGVATSSATSITSSSATLNGNLMGMGNASSVNVWFDYTTDAYYVGNSGSYGNSTTSQAMGATGTFNASISGLLGNTTYHFRAAASDGNNTAYGSDATFTTAQAPKVTTNAATDVTSDSATLNGNLTSLGNSSSVNVWFQYATDAYYVGNSGSYSNSTAVQAMGAIGTFTASISGLSGNTTYHFRAMASDGNTTVSGADETFDTAININLQGWGWCTNYNQVVAITFDGYTTMVERANAPNSYSMHMVGNLTLPAPYNETISLDMYGNRARLLFYLRQEVTGKSVDFRGTWIVNAAGNETYIGMSGSVALPNPQGEAFGTSRICFAFLRTPSVDVPLTEPGSFADDLDSMLSRLIKFFNSTLNSLIGTGFAGILSNILDKLAVLLAHIRSLGIPYIS